MKNFYHSTLSQSFDDLFADPPSLFRGAPLWSWNNRLNREQLLRQIGVMQEMGLGGFTIHPRTGLDTEYLGESFMEHVRACMEKGRDCGMLTWLYDEDRWPSGFAGGRVTQNPDYRARHLLLTPTPYAENEIPAVRHGGGSYGSRTGQGRLLARYALNFDQGALADYRRLDSSETPRDEEHLWYAYLEVQQISDWFNRCAYVDTLNPDAMKAFIRETHERYRKAVGDEFSRAVPAIFTDEPQFAHKTTLNFAEEPGDLFLPWTDDLPDSYRETYGAELLDTLPEIVWEHSDGQPSLSRYRYHDHVAERFAQAFADTVGAWCEAQGLPLTGHMMEEPTLFSQTRALGEAMRSYRSFHLPGIDMLCDLREYTTAKQAQSASRQYGRNGVMSELYGVTDWDFDFRGHKSQGDWQAALGVTHRVHHLSWVSMKGEAKRDYPASMLEQSPWYRKYPAIEDHFARVNAAMTRGKARVRIGVLHPIESFWLCWGPRDQTGTEQARRDTAFQEMTEWLLFGQLDFDFICESLLPEQNPNQEGDRFRVGDMAYEAVIVPPMRTIRASTLERLQAFADAGGCVVFSGEIPSLVDAIPNEGARMLAGQTRHIDFDRAVLLNALEPFRDFSIVQESGAPHDALLYQWRDDGDQGFLFLCDARREVTARNPETTGWCTPPLPCRLRIHGEYDLVALNTTDGSSAPIPAQIRNGWTEWTHTFHAIGHQLIRLQARRSENIDPHDVPAPSAEATTLQHLCGRFPVTLSEPNVLLLDQPEWRWKESPWRNREDILRITNLIREEEGLPQLHGSIAQPWTNTETPKTLGKIQLRFRWTVETEVSDGRLALEDRGETEIRLNGQLIDTPSEGWWVDESIETVSLPSMVKGEHELVLEQTVTDKTSLEACYLLGDFGVELQGQDARLTEPVRSLSWGCITGQGLPFYSGNVTYHLDIDLTDHAEARLQIPRYEGAMVGVSSPGEKEQDIITAPYTAELGTLDKGRHQIDVTLYGTRFNTFGALHLTGRFAWAGPGAYRSEGAYWSYEYNTRPMGILCAPILLLPTKTLSRLSAVASAKGEALPARPKP